MSYGSAYRWVSQAHTSYYLVRSWRCEDDYHFRARVRLLSLTHRGRDVREVDFKGLCPDLRVYSRNAPYLSSADTLAYDSPTAFLEDLLRVAKSEPRYAGGNVRSGWQDYWEYKDFFYDGGSDSDQWFYTAREMIAAKDPHYLALGPGRALSLLRHAKALWVRPIYALDEPRTHDFTSSFGEGDPLQADEHLVGYAYIRGVSDKDPTLEDELWFCDCDVVQDVLSLDVYDAVLYEADGAAVRRVRAMPSRHDEGRQVELALDELGLGSSSAIIEGPEVEVVPLEGVSNLRDARAACESVCQGIQRLAGVPRRHSFSVMRRRLGHGSDPFSDERRKASCVSEHATFAEAAQAIESIDVVCRLEEYSDADVYDSGRLRTGDTVECVHPVPYGDVWLLPEREQVDRPMWYVEAQRVPGAAGC